MIHNYAYVAKKYAFDLLKERYAPNEDIIGRMAHYLATEQNVRAFGQLLVNAFSRGYDKAVADYRAKLRDMGYDVRIVAEKK